MGLRERKTARTRRQIVDVALDLFVEQGYDETTMEQIAERAEVGSTTLYRYFPSKDLLILDRFTQSMDLGARLRSRPSTESLSVALGAVIHASIEGFADEDGRVTALRRIVDNAPVPRARLWDLVAQAQSDLESAIAARLDRPPGDLQVVLTATLTFAVFQIAAEKWWAGDHRASRAAVVDEVLRALAASDLVLPSP
ncbi:TetR/AcrR family transcriptional regulator [Tenggerimyces flavus]|uniref:TetR/AcrR family transcriptional regulator n=1 Tax=Tenggerimyces flavus TaxID=1708749 RepID=A0ABV7YNX6_9ACTN|nr:TetR/AcrR family transcriptional regulator [Tenggerimyces flavus]MBM7789348.1 AcrR family transcriptional regulator [Tenggerimyces flavus]